MHLKQGIEITKFLQDVMNCQDEVYFETPEGDLLALKSALIQYIFCSITNEADILHKGMIRTQNQKDTKLLSEYCF